MCAPGHSRAQSWPQKRHACRIAVANLELLAQLFAIVLFACCWSRAFFREGYERASSARDQGFQQFAERFGIEWPGDERIAAGRFRFALADASARRDRRDGDVPRVLVHLQSKDRFEPADERRSKVKDDHVGRQHGGHENGILAVRDRLDEPTGSPHAPCIELASILIVIHDEGSGSSARPGAEWRLRWRALSAVPLSRIGVRARWR
jgi:hypothetical protein